MSRRALLIALRVGVSAGLIGWLATRVDLHGVLAAMAAIGPGEVLAILALQLLNTALKSYKWQKLLAADGIHLSHPTVFASYMVGTFFSIFLPTSVGGDAVRAVDAARRSGRRVATVTSVAADRVLGFVAIGMIGLVSLAAGAASSLKPEIRLGGALLYVGVLVASSLLFARWPLEIVRRLHVPGFPTIERVARSATQSLDAYRQSGRLLELALLSVAAQGIVVVVVYMLARSLEIDAPLSYFFAIVPLVGLVESIPISIYGIGLRDATYVSLLGLLGTPQERSLSLSVLYVALSLLYALLGGVVFLFRRSPQVAAEDRRRVES